MKTIVLLAALAATAFVVARGQSGLYPNFPYCKCRRSPSPYSLDPTIATVGNNTFCFTVKVRVPVGCTSFCCQADLRKIELNVRQECDVTAAVVKVTVNGVYTPVGPSIDTPKEGPSGTRVLKLTQLGLSTSSDGALVCMTLTSRWPNAKVCRTLEELCLPPGNATAGVCSAALFDGTNDCCPISTVSKTRAPSPSPNPPRPSFPSPPAAPPPPPPPPPPSPGPPITPLPICTVCAYYTLNPKDPIFPISVSIDDCNRFARMVVSNITSLAAANGAKLEDSDPVITCTEGTAKVCLDFATDADGQKLQDDIGPAADLWLTAMTGSGAQCPAYLNFYNITVAVGGDDSDYPEYDYPPPSCLSAFTSKNCAPGRVPFPKDTCNTRQLATRFAAFPDAFSAPGTQPNSTFYCFTLIPLPPRDPTSPCGRTKTLYEMNFWANDRFRRRLIQVALLPGDTSDVSFQPPDWGEPGDDTLTVGPLDWTDEQANFALVCLELDRSVTLGTFCNTGLSSNTCWMAMYDESRNCCPLYPSTLAPGGSRRKLREVPLLRR